MKVKDLIKKLLDCDQELPIYINLDKTDPQDCAEIYGIGRCWDGPNSFYALTFLNPGEEPEIWNDFSGVNSN